MPSRKGLTSLEYSANTRNTMPMTARNGKGLPRRRGPSIYIQMKRVVKNAFGDEETLACESAVDKKHRGREMSRNQKIRDVQMHLCPIYPCLPRRCRVAKSLLSP